MRVAELAQALEIAFRWDEAARRSGDGLDEARSDVFGAVQIDEANQILGELDPVRAFTAGEVVFLQVRVPHVRDAGRRRGLDLASDVQLSSIRSNALGDLRLLIVDPITSYLGRIDSHRITDVRSVLEPFVLINGQVKAWRCGQPSNSGPINEAKMISAEEREIFTRRPINNVCGRGCSPPAATRSSSASSSAAIISFTPLLPLVGSLSRPGGNRGCMAGARTPKTPQS